MVSPSYSRDKWRCQGCGTNKEGKIGLLSVEQEQEKFLYEMHYYRISRRVTYGALTFRNNQWILIDFRINPLIFSEGQQCVDKIVTL